ncbi:MAG TPA: putative ABC exporter domain-containing protein [Candidatus Polarisedimenticolia bacterium]
MTGAFLFLTLRTFKNRLLSQIRRLKRPRYLFFAIVGVAYFYGVAGRHWMAGARIASRGDLSILPPVLAEVAASFLIMGSIVVAWCNAPPISPLAFTQAEIQHLFTAPITRRALIRWKLMKGQVGVLFSVSIFTLFAGPHLARGDRLLFFAGAWIVFATMQLHMTGIRLALHGMKQRGTGWGRRVAVTLAVTVAAVGTAALWASSRVGAPPTGLAGKGEALAAFGRYVEALAASGPAWILLLPGRLLVRPALATSLTRFLLDGATAAGLLALNYLWVMGSGVALEEGAIEGARRIEETRAARSGGRGIGRSPRRLRATRPPFSLAPVGRPEIALLWKNLIAAFRNVGGLRPLVWIIGLNFALILVILRVSRPGTAHVVIGAICGMLAGMLLIVGPSILRIDFRQDLPHMDTLRSYPLAGRSLLVGTLLAPILVLTAIEWMLLSGFAILMGGVIGEGTSWSTGPAVLALTGAILAIPMTGVATLIHNAGLLLLPAWVSLGPSRSWGVERMGQGIFTTIGLLLVMALSLIPAALIFGVSWFLCSAFTGNSIALPVSALPAAAALAGECWLGVVLLGAYLDRFDPSKELDSVTQAG